MSQHNGRADACCVARCRRAWSTRYNCNGVDAKLCQVHRDRFYDLIEAARDRVRATNDIVDFTLLLLAL